MKITLSGYDEKPRSIMETLEFFVKNDTVYTTTDLKEADALYAARSLVSKSLMDCREVYLPLEDSSTEKKWSEKAKYERIKVYSLNDAGRKYYKTEKKQ